MLADARSQLLSGTSPTMDNEEEEAVPSQVEVDTGETFETCTGELSITVSPPLERCGSPDSTASQQSSLFFWQKWRWEFLFFFGMMVVAVGLVFALKYAMTQPIETLDVSYHPQCDVQSRDFNPSNTIDPKMKPLIGTALAEYIWRAFQLWILVAFDPKALLDQTKEYTQKDIEERLEQSALNDHLHDCFPKCLVGWLTLRRKAILYLGQLFLVVVSFVIQTWCNRALWVMLSGWWQENPFHSFR